MHTLATPKRSARKYMVEISRRASFTMTKVAPQITATSIKARSARQRADPLLTRFQVMRPVAKECGAGQFRGALAGTTLALCGRRRPGHPRRSKSPEDRAIAERWRRWRR